MFRYHRALLFVLPACSLLGQEPVTVGTPGWFPFPISVSDATSTPTSQATLNECPAGVSGFVRVEGEHLVDGNGRVLRLFGTNLCFGANFPNDIEAPKLAAHLAKMGINIVRLHHMDGDKTESLIEDNATTKLNAGNLAKLDRLIAELIQRGIYVNINLHVSRTYPGTPEGAPKYSKGIDHFYPPFIDLFKSYARQLLEHVNPHTGRAYKDEPGVALIEMKNENTLLLNPWWLLEMPEPFAKTILEPWLNFLQRHYANTEALRASWGSNDGSTGPDILRNGALANGAEHWNREALDGAVSGFTSLPDGTPGIRWVSTAIGRNAHSLQLHQSALQFDLNSGYRFTFRARSGTSTELRVTAMNSAPPFQNIGLDQRFILTQEWKTYRFDFIPGGQLPDGKNRIGFNLMNRLGQVDLADVRLCRIPDGFLKPGETFEAGNIPLPEFTSNLNVRRDFFRFLAELEISHAKDMKAFLRDEIGVKQIITHSHVLFGGIAGARREFAVSDVVDTHGYWQHPSFPRKSWDLSDWVIGNDNQIAEPSGGTLAEIAMQRPVGKPYSLSEYDIPAPNDFASDTFPCLAAMASLQDWSAVYHFAFSHNSDFGREKLGPFFDLVGHPAKQAFLPLAALVFRERLIPPFTEESLLPLTSDQINEFTAKKSGAIWGSWREVWAEAGLSGALAWQRRVGLDLRDSSNKKAAKAASEGTVRVDWKPEESRLVIESEKALIASGRLGEYPVGESCTITLGVLPGTGCATLMLVPLDGLPLATSKKLWLAALCRAENPGMAWNPARTTVGKNWGEGPALILGVQGEVKLPGNPTWKVCTLDPTGKVATTLAEMTNVFQINPDQKTVWWLMTRE